MLKQEKTQTENSTFKYNDVILMCFVKCP